MKSLSLILCLALACCATDNAQPVVVGCPEIRTIPQAEQCAIARDAATLPPNSALQKPLLEWDHLRSQLAQCQAQPKPQTSFLDFFHLGSNASPPKGCPENLTQTPAYQDLEPMTKPQQQIVPPTDQTSEQPTSPKTSWFGNAL